MRLEIKYKKEKKKKRTTENANMWKLNNMLVKRAMRNRQKLNEGKNTWRQVKIKAQQPKIFEMQKISSKMEIYSDKSLFFSGNKKNMK